jgi:NADPH:quinone reductase-like Zn-dependent oxidoreductase
MTQAVLYDGAGPATQVLRVGDIADPGEPGYSQILIRVTAFPVHPGDLQAVAGPFRGRPGTPMIAGLEATGVVEAIGPGTEAPPGVVVGARVTFIHAGAWSERVITDTQTIAAVPPDVPDDHAARMLINPLTAQLLRRATQRSPATGYNGVTIQAAAGSAVARLLTATSIQHDETLVNLVRSPEGAEPLAARFPSIPVIVTDHAGWRDEVRRAAGERPITVALDPVGGRLAADLLGLLADGGILVAYSALGPEPVPLHYRDLQRGLTITNVNVGRWSTITSLQERAWDIETAIGMVLQHPAQLDVAAHYDLHEIAAAAEHATRPGKVGIIVVHP